MLKIVSLLLLCTFPLCVMGCADTKWANKLTGEPDDSVLNAPRAAGRPVSTIPQEWPKLGEVPDRPADTTPPAGWHYLSRQMMIDRRQAEEAKAAFEDNPQPE